MSHFLFQQLPGKTEVGVSPITLGQEERLARTTIFVFRKNQGMKSLREGFLRVLVEPVWAFDLNTHFYLLRPSLT